MLPVHEITKSLPPQREDEPPALRENIADEIIDHLQCSLRRELLVHGNDEATAKKRVLNKFGDPGQIARKLWFQAMWSKIMTQRLIIGSSIFSTVVSITLLGFVGWMVQQTQAQQQEQQRVNTALIDQLAMLVTRSKESVPQPDPNWNRLKIMVSIATKDGPPAVGYQIDVNKQQRIGDDTKGSSFAAVVDESGVVDCGFVDPGIYEITVNTPWYEVNKMKLTIHSGQDYLQQVVAPEDMPEGTNVSVSVNGIPDNLNNTKQILKIWFEPKGARFVADRLWTFGTTVFDSPFFLVIVPGDGVWVYEPLDEKNKRKLERASNQALAENWSQLDATHEIERLSDRYTVHFDFVDLPDAVVPGNHEWQQNQTLQQPRASIVWPHQPVELLAETGKINDWTITLPDDVVASLRDRSKRPVRLRNVGGGMGGGMYRGMGGGMF